MCEEDQNLAWGIQEERLAWGLDEGGVCFGGGPLVRLKISSSSSMSMSSSTSSFIGTPLPPTPMAPHKSSRPKQRRMRLGMISCEKFLHNSTKTDLISEVTHLILFFLFGAVKSVGILSFKRFSGGLFPY